MSKAKGTMTVTLPNGRQMDVPRGLSGDKLEMFVQGKLKEEQAAATLAEVQRVEEASELERTRVEMAQLKQQMAESMKVIAELQEQNAQLKLAGPDAASGAIALMQATRDAERLRRELINDLGAASEWRSAFGEDISDVAAEVRKKNKMADSELAERRRANKILFDDIRESQGMERQHPELLEVESNVE